jgi:5-methylcytosine-specific restriction endonuclease McrA
MGKWIHRLSDVDENQKIAVCTECGPVSIRAMGYGKNGKKMWRCKTARVFERRFRERPWLSFKKDICERCGFIPEHSSQLDVDHINGNHFDHNPTNLQTLCANCHRLKTHSNKEWLPKGFVVNPSEQQ